MTVENPRTIASRPSRSRTATTHPVRTAEKTGFDTRLQAGKGKDFGRRDRRHVTVRRHGSGTGRTRRTRSRIFDPFFSTKGQEATRGPGQGLSMSKGIAEAVGGSLDFLNHPHRGGVFRFSGPR